MNKLISLLILISTSALADCFIAKEGNHIILQEGDCIKRNAPCSTFKIAVSLMGYNEGILIDEMNPEESFKPGDADFLPIWKQPHNPTTWMKNSCVWYSQRITNKIGIKKFQNYLADFKYGKLDYDKADIINRSWLNGSLNISPKEQLRFLEHLVENKLPVSLKAQELTKNILFIDTISGWNLYGKTGGCDGEPNNNYQIGWFIGWFERDNRRIIFIHNIEDSKKMDYSAGGRAKKAVLDNLTRLIK
jgi:beta-lactamase class D